MIPFRLALLTLGLLAAGLAPAATSLAAEAPAAGPAAQYFQQVTRVAPRVSVLMQGPRFHVQPIGNVVVIEQADGLVLVDAGGSPGAGRRVVELVRSISPKPVKAIVITHWHGDHHFGLSAVLAAWPQASVISTQATLEHMNRRGLPDAPDPAWDARETASIASTVKVWQGFAASDAKAPWERAGYAYAGPELQAYGEDLRGASIRRSTRTFTDRLVLPDADAPVEVMFLGRANTDGDAVVWLPRQKIVATGDIVVAPVPFGGGYPAEWIQPLGKVRALGFATLIPGHGAVQTDRTYIDKLVSALTDVRAQVTALAAQGLGPDQTHARVDLSGERRSIVGDDPWLGFWFDQDWSAVIDCAYAEVKGVAIVQGKPCKPAA